ncbi:LOB domain-containing protein CRL1-like [Dioscorea cayenensis subsp. rotundata]|uniref:LOB domain-containing protein CRL1-like n=1 Tax=Dioscorea cayennensis subsp. rotundata TaxID=55577 RepID=A0AB40CHB0_DIOCR|nr:LOB domain-containing protein CRL1-like [Dioscorea cayenensis subsp. rotundata]
MTGLGSPCGACKFLRRKCVRGCIFAPYFCHEQASTHFAAIHKVFGASNVSKLLMHLPVHDRFEAALSISYEAQARLQDPIYGCVSQIFSLQQQVINLEAQIACFKAEATTNCQQFQAQENFKIEQTLMNGDISMHFNDIGIQSSSQNLVPSSSLVDEFPFALEDTSLDSFMEATNYLY